MILDNSNIITMYMSSQHASDQELEEQLNIFIQVAENSGYNVTKKTIEYSQGFKIVEVEAIK